MIALYGQLCPLAALAALVASCASGAASPSSSDGGGPPLSVTAADHGLSIALRTDPEPPPRGTFDATFTITDETGATVDGLTVDVVPWMPAMGHGASVKPSVSASGSGLYLVKNISAFMPGTWELRVFISGPRSDHAVVHVDIP